MADHTGAYQLVRLANGTASIRSTADRETFHPVAGPEKEAELLYVRQLELTARVAAHSGEFVIWDVGLGSAANPTVALRQISDIAARVRIISFDRTTEALSFALGVSTELPYLHGFEPALGELLQAGATQFQSGNLQVRWDLHVGDFPALLAQQSATSTIPRPHAIFFDAFSPARNPEMWTLDLFRALRVAIAEERCSLATFSRSTIARATMLAAGFYVGCGEALAGKEETTVAATDLSLIRSLLGEDWLARAFRSHSAEPLNGPTYVQAPLTEATRELLLRHPQFANGDGRSGRA